jgi:tetratricopeptide (TPR) repeat protein
MRSAGLAIAPVLVVLAGCAQQYQAHEQAVAVPPETMAAYLEDKPEPARRLYQRVLLEGDRNVTLNDMRAGLASFELDDAPVAVGSFDDALSRIEAIYANNPKAEQARSLWVKENIKDFKGEPYERAMAYYYRGLLYFKSGDYENARASFKGAMLQDTLSATETFSKSFALMAYLEGWASKCAGDSGLAADSFNEAIGLNAALTVPRPEDNALLIAELGGSPIKVAVGEHREKLQFQRGSGWAEESATFLVPRGSTGSAPSYQLAEPVKAADLYIQASTRGGRPIDAILDNKAVYKDTTNTVGDVAMAAGGATFAAGLLSGNRDAAIAGALVGLFGAMAKASADAMRPEADVRYWDNLPDTIMLATLVAPDPLIEAAVQYKDDRGAPTRPDPVKFKVTNAGRCSIGWVRSRSALSIPDAAPGAVAPIAAK